MSGLGAARTGRMVHEVVCVETTDAGCHGAMATWSIVFLDCSSSKSATQLVSNAPTQIVKYRHTTSEVWKEVLQKILRHDAHSIFHPLIKQQMSRHWWPVCSSPSPSLSTRKQLASRLHGDLRCSLSTNLAEYYRTCTLFGITRQDYCSRRAGS
jgi:hypothetical protein